jgi:hypothetical protein
MPSRRHNTSLSSVIAARLPGIGSGDTVMPAIGSTAKGASVARRRFQRGSVFKNRPKTVWLGQYSNYVLETHGVEKRQRTQICLGPVRKFDGSHMTKREAQRLLQPYVDFQFQITKMPRLRRSRKSGKEIIYVYPNPPRDALCVGNSNALQPP